jgi:O-acetyl-ADP-ribose deacetylase (regulator of RNase III)
VTPHIVESDGSIFDSGCTALVSPVDAVTGAQGKGLALEFRRRWPERCAMYRQECIAGHMSGGGVYLDWAEDPALIFAATKQHWRKVSDASLVASCLLGIERIVNRYGVRSVAIPALGCGLGNLSWRDVRPLMLDAAARMQCERVAIYGPK